MPDVMQRTRADHRPDGDPVHDLARQRAIRQDQRKRHFRISTVLSAIGMMILAVIWMSSGLHQKWSFWIVYPLGGWLLVVVIHTWLVYGNKLIIESGMDRS